MCACVEDIGEGGGIALMVIGWALSAWRGKRGLKATSLDGN